ncbi:unnamed protein product [Orchesella dallaii]|uniref:Uncharacterized protein n=1 Tax=Orchesella dallaii TaxID=48710 RepID=A0ABP1PN64_9HEXA
MNKDIVEGKRTVRQSTSAPKQEAFDDLALAQRHHRRQRRNRIHQHEKKTLRKQRSVSDLLTDLLLKDKENRPGSSSGSIMSSEDFRNRPDLWMAAFDNPMEFIQYCRKRLDHQREVLDRSVQNENYISRSLTQLLEKFEQQEKQVRDLFTVQNINEKLHHVLLEERTHCQHLIGDNDRLETERRMMSRKYQAALLLGKVEEKSVHHLLEKNPKAVPLADRMAEIGDELKKCDLKSKTTLDCADPVVLADRLERAEVLILALKRTHQEEVTGLKDTIDNYNLQFQSVHQSYDNIIQKQSDLLNGQKEMVEALTRENLELRSELIKKDDKFLEMQMNVVELNVAKKPSQTTHYKQDIEQAIDQSDSGEKLLQTRLAKAEINLIEKSNTLRDVTSKMLVLERKYSQLKEEMEVMTKSHKTCVKALKSRNEMLEKRWKNMDERRKFDNAGFRSEVKELRSVLKTLQSNVNLIIKKYGDVHLDKKGFAKPDAAVLDQILKKGGVDGSRYTSERLGPSVSSAHPITNQMALSIWCDYVGNRIDELDADLNPKLGALLKVKEDLEHDTYSESLDGEQSRESRKVRHVYRTSFDEYT